MDKSTPTSKALHRRLMGRPGSVRPLAIYMIRGEKYGQPAAPPKGR